MSINTTDIAVAIVEDDPEIRELLEKIIDRSPGYSCKHVFGNCEEALIQLGQIKPDVVLMDIELPGMNGIEGVKRLKNLLPDTDFIMLTIREEDEMVFQSLCSGATGYLIKETPPVKLLEAIRDVHEGGAPMSPAIARKVAQSFQPQKDNPLSDREREVLSLLSDGGNYTSISEKLFISGHTVRAHIKNIYRKLHVGSRAEAVIKALKRKLL